MRKTLLLSLLLLVCGVVAKAQVVPHFSTDEVVYEYYLRNHGNNYAFATTSVGANNQIGAVNRMAASNPTSACLKVKLVKVSADSDAFYLQATNVAGKENAYIVSEGLVSGTSAIKYADVNTGHAQWKLMAGEDHTYKLALFDNETYNFCLYSVANTTPIRILITSDLTSFPNHSTWTFVPANVEALDAHCGNYKEALAKTGVGYPVADDAARLALQTKAEEVEGKVTGLLTLNSSDITALSAALTAYKTSENIQMPEDGKTYTFTGVLHDGRKRYLNYNGTSAYTLVDYTEGDALPSTAQFICRKDGDHYVFTNNAGKYFLWYGSGEGYDGNDGVQDAYDEHTYFTIDKLVKGTNTNVVVDSDAELFGYMCIKGQRNNSGSAYQQSYFILKKEKGLDRASDQFFKDSHSSAFLIEEVTTDSPSQVKFSVNLDGVGYVATYSAKYPSVVPEDKGIVAYYASQNTGSNVTMTPIEGAIPANTGVVLISESEQTVGMAPLAAAAPEALTTNLLRHSAGEATTISAESGKTAYILANGSEGVGFYAHDGSATQLKMNKSYLVIDTPTGGNAVKLVFGGTATGIEDAVEADDEAAPVYDLSGRKVSAPVKGGIYVKNGKKIIF